MLYPSYDGPGNAATMKSSPLVKVMFMNWIGQPSKNGLPSTAKSDGLLGWLAGINYVPLMENGVLFQDAGAGEYMYAKSFTISFQLTVLHEEQVGWDGNGKSATTDFSNSFYFASNFSKHFLFPKCSKKVLGKLILEIFLKISIIIFFEKMLQ